jgi:hypothetical protein
MSALGHKQTFAVQKSMSALPPKADMCSATRDVRFVPIADSCSAAKRWLFDHLVGDLLEMHRHIEAQRLGGLEVDGKLILRRRLHRHVGWLLALEDAVALKSANCPEVKSRWWS